jgi:hypothetical protein
MVQQLADGPLCPGPNGAPYLPYSTAGNRFGRMLDYLGISGVHTHSLRRQFASERGPGRQPARTRQTQPGPRPRQHRDHAVGAAPWRRTVPRVSFRIA